MKRVNKIPESMKKLLESFDQQYEEFHCTQLELRSEIDETEQKIPLHIKSLTGRVHTLWLYPRQTILDIKCELEKLDPFFYIRRNSD